jgi:acyl transferase domain-containing protein
VAVVNGPHSTVLAGDPAALAEIVALLEARGVLCRPIRAGYASHSPSVEPLRTELLRVLLRDQPEWESLLTSLGTVYTHGGTPDWTKLHDDGRFVPLPSYPWRRRRFWVRKSACFP